MSHNPAKSSDTPLLARDLIKLLQAAENDNFHSIHHTVTSPHQFLSGKLLSGKLKVESPKHTPERLSDSTTPTQAARGSHKADKLPVTKFPSLSDMAALQSLANSDSPSSVEAKGAASALLSSSNTAKPILFALQIVHTHLVISLKAIELLSAICDHGIEKSTQNTLRTIGVLGRLSWCLRALIAMDRDSLGAESLIDACRECCYIFQNTIGREANRDALVQDGTVNALLDILENRELAQLSDILDADICVAISNISFGSVSRKQAVGSRGIRALHQVIISRKGHDKVICYAMLALRNLCFECTPVQQQIISESNGAVLKTLTEIGGGHTIQTLEAENEDVVATHHHCMVALSNICSVLDENRKSLTDAGAADIVVQILNDTIEAVKAKKDDLRRELALRAFRLGSDAIRLSRNLSAGKMNEAQLLLGEKGAIPLIVSFLRLSCHPVVPSLKNKMGDLPTKLASLISKDDMNALVDEAIVLVRYLAFPDTNRDIMFALSLPTDFLVPIMVEVSKADEVSRKKLFLRDEKLLESAILALGNAAFGLQDVKTLIGRERGIEAVVIIATNHLHSIQLTEASLRTLRCLADSCPLNQRLEGESKVIEYVTECMKRYPAEEGIQEQSCALLLVISLSDINVARLQQAGVVDLVIYSLSNFPKHRGVHLQGALLLDRMNGADAKDVEITRENVQQLGIKTRSSAIKKSVFAGAGL